MRKDASAVMKGMARDRLIGRYFPEFREISYFVDSSELFADRHYVAQIKPFFTWKLKQDARFEGIDVDKFVCATEFRRRGHEFPELILCRTTDDVRSVYSAHLEELQHRKRFAVERMLDLPEQSTHLQKFLESSEISAVIHASDGLQESDLLCKYVASDDPAYFRDLICIKDTYCRGLRGFAEKTLGAGIGVRQQTWRDLSGLDVKPVTTDNERGYDY